AALRSRPAPRNSAAPCSLTARGLRVRLGGRHAPPLRPMALRFYNTLTRQDEEFVPLGGGEVRLYTCGPTVYDYAHIGNFRTYLWEDLLRRHLELRGHKVTQVMNLTDVDDKTIACALRKGMPL